MKKIKCPICGKELIQLNVLIFETGYEYCYEFWCDDCKINIIIETDKEI